MDEDLLALLGGLRGNDRAGVDCPFGWPVEFVRAVAAHGAGLPWPGRGEGSAEYRARLRLRHTDRLVWEALRPGQPPLSVAFDKLGAAAARWAHLADALAVAGQPVDRSGAGRVVEVYPRAARVRWGLATGRSVSEILDALPWLRCDEQARVVYEKNEHAFDALIAALNARAVHQGLTTLPAPADADLAESEGWIHLPESGSLPRLL